MTNQSKTTTMSGTTASSTMGRIAAAVYGSISYVIFFATFNYVIFFVCNMFVPKTIDSGTPGPFVTSLAVNVALLALFGLQHSVMARPGFKRMWTKIVPKPIERSTYVLAASACLILMMWQWRPMPGTLWTVDEPVMRALLFALYFAGGGIVLVSTFMINHFELFGLRQVFYFLTGKPEPGMKFQVNGLYKYVRHPLMLGFIITAWATPDMTVGHMVYACVITSYILIALRYEERDLVNQLGDQYRDYQRRVYGLLPFKKYDQPVRETVTNPVMGD